MRLALLALAFMPAACGQSEPPPPLPETPQRAAQPWFICDAIDAPVVLVFEREGQVARVAQYSKPDGALVQRTDYRIGVEDGAAGSVYTTLLQNGAEAGHLRRTNPSMLEEPSSAYTLRFTSVRIGEREITCRWLPRTRVFGVTGRRSVVVQEDASGDLIYTSYDFAAAANAPPVDLSENAQTTTFSLEARGGAESTSALGTQYQFQADSETTITVTVGRDGAGAVDVRRHGPEPLQAEQFIAFQTGEGAE